MRKFLPYILIGIVMVGIFGPFGIQNAHAAFWDNIWESAKKGVGTLVAWVIYIVIFLPASGILWISGQFFNTTIALSLNNEAFNAPIVSIGWTITRDITNLFFIFILLYIAIATILQLSGYGMKELLAKVIIIALLVNFSLVITKVVIDASNILALEFYDKMTVEGGTVTTAVFGKNVRDISGVFLSGFNPQKLLGSKGFEDVVEEGVIDTIIAAAITYLFASIIVLIAAFVLFAASILFIIRTVVLWLLMILAPIAFLFMILPATKQYASIWWNNLFKQSFFAPAFLFLYYLVVVMIKSGFLENAIKKVEVPGGILGGLAETFSLIMFIALQLITLGILLIACLIVAQQIGAYGASTVQKWGQGAAKWGQTWAGRGARRITAPVAEKVATGEGRVAKTLRAIPGVTRGAATIAAKERTRTVELQKGYEKYSNAELKNLITRVMPLNRTAIVQELTKRNKLKTEGGLTDDQLRRHRKTMKQSGIDTKDFDRLRPDTIDRETEGKEWRDTRDKALTKANWVDIDKDTVQKLFNREKNPNFEKDIDAIIKGSTSSVARKLVEEVGGDAEKEFFNALKRLGKSVDEIADKLAGPEIGNYSMAGWVRTTPVRPIMKAHGIETKEEREEKPPTPPPAKPWETPL